MFTEYSHKFSTKRPLHVSVGTPFLRPATDTKRRSENLWASMPASSNHFLSTTSGSLQMCPEIISHAQTSTIFTHGREQFRGRESMGGKDLWNRWVLLLTFISEVPVSSLGVGKMCTVISLSRLSRGLM